ncbi:MAG: response regulator [Candidatus Zixiibacteriota bacterium]
MLPIKVLIVDDERDFADALAERMKKRDIVVDIAEDGPSAINCVSSKNYDAIVLDLVLPGMDGIETLKQIVALKPDLQVILLTGRGSIEKGVEAIKCGAFEFLEKPVKLENLLEKINKAKSKKDALTEQHTNDMIDEILKRRSW